MDNYCVSVRTVGSKPVPADRVCPGSRYTRIPSHDLLQRLPSKLNLRHLCLLSHLFFYTHIQLLRITMCDDSGWQWLQYSPAAAKSISMNRWRGNREIGSTIEVM